MGLVECVPNFSEGRDRAILEAITAEIGRVEGAALLDVDPGAATNRTVVTFAGPPEAVLEAAFRVIRKASELIDMSRHRGEHPRMGATDVCPFVPMQGATMAECVELAERLGRRVGEELGIPIYLYGEAARRPDRRRLPDIRQGEYEALPAKLQDPGFAPDFGPARFVPRSGVTAIGAREFLIAWNVNLNTRDKRVANRVAAELRETGKPRKDAAGKTLRGPDGAALREPGRFRDLQGGGWYIAEYGRAQISFNLMNYPATGLHTVFDAACAEAERLGARVTGSELVGLVPLDALLDAGDHYLARLGRTAGVPERERVHAAVLSLGLGELSRFDPAEKVIEYRYRGAPKGLRAMRLTDFADELSSESPAPGGGSVAALCGSLSAALSSMVAALTWAKKGMEEKRPAMGAIGTRGQALKDWFLEAVDRDTAAFDAVLAARRLPSGSESEKVARAAAIRAADLEATRVPLAVLERAVEALELALAAARDGNPQSVSDAGVAGLCASAAAEGAAYNVRINLPGLGDGDEAAGIRDDLVRLVARARELSAEARDAVERAL